jgi:hypothetical protein
MAVPSVWRTNRTMAAAKVDALSSGGMDDFEIPAFLRPADFTGRLHRPVTAGQVAPTERSGHEGSQGVQGRPERDFRWL